jgi:hypothetical protein
MVAKKQAGNANPGGGSAGRDLPPEQGPLRVVEGPESAENSDPQQHPPPSSDDRQSASRITPTAAQRAAKIRVNGVERSLLTARRQGDERVGNDNGARVVTQTKVTRTWRMASVTVAAAICMHAMSPTSSCTISARRARRRCPTPRSSTCTELLQVLRLLGGG